MGIEVARQILERLGGGRIAHVGAGDYGLAIELRLNGCVVGVDGEDDAIDDPQTVVVDAPDGALRTLAHTLERYPGAQNIALRAPGAPLRETEAFLFAAGWRRHPAGMTLWEYESISDQRLPQVSYYQRIPPEAAARWSVEDLLEDRGLHMDMLRESGSRADGHIVRYVLAAQYVRPGDRVLDCACGLGYGTAVMAAMSRGADFLGMDLDAETCGYAQANYARPGLRYTPGDLSVLDGVEDHSIDLIVSMETLEHVPDWQAGLAAFKRVLKPDGRIVCSVPDRWMDETGEDPNPHHLHVFDWQKLADGLAQHFVLEAKYIQSAPGGFKLPDSPRVLRQRPMEIEEDTEWLVAVVSGNMFDVDDEKRAAFRHPQFDRDGRPPAVVGDIGGAYDNPYLYRSLIQMGERITDDEKLVRLALMVVQNARPDSPDRGGAIAVLGYRMLEARNLDAAPQLMAMIEDYAAPELTGGPPHVERWRVSLAFLAARLMELTGDQDGAVHWYRQVLARGWSAFSPLLATKTIAAAFFEGRLHLFAGREDRARAAFERGVRESLAAARAPGEDIIGADPANPLAFGLTELAEVLDMGSQCANALANLHLWPRAPGLFWKQIDVRRFGLAGWAKDLEQENARLRAMAG